MSTRIKLIGFDLDGTLWSPEMYQLNGGAPFEAAVDQKNVLLDRRGTEVHLLGISAIILHELKFNPRWSHVKVAWVSKCDEPRWAEECLSKFITTSGEEDGEGCAIGDVAHMSLIYNENKQSHFRRLKEEFPDIAFDEMLFFDNERGNIVSVSQLGVKVS